MIKISREGRLEIDLFFDKRGAEELLHAFSSVHDNGSKSQVTATVDLSVMTSKRDSGSKEMPVLIGLGDGSIHRDGDSVVWLFEEDEVEYAIKRFEECLETREFSPAEFVQLKAGKRSDLQYVYGKFVAQGEQSSLPKSSQ